MFIYLYEAQSVFFCLFVLLYTRNAFLVLHWILIKRKSKRIVMFFIIYLLFDITTLEQTMFLLFVLLGLYPFSRCYYFLYSCQILTNFFYVIRYFKESCTEKVFSNASYKSYKPTRNICCFVIFLALRVMFQRSCQKIK